MREPPEKDPPKQDSAAMEGSPAKRRSRRSTSAKPIAPSDSSGRSASASTAGTGRIYIGAIAVLALGLATQAVLGFRDSLAAHVPATRPLLGAVCRAFGCTIDPLRDAAALFIEASDLQADPAHRGLLLLTATIRNRADHAIAYPYLELKLTDSADQVVVVRAFAPSEYAGGTAELRNGIPANGEHIVRIFIDASATQQAGYRLYLFYP